MADKTESQKREPTQREKGSAVMIRMAKQVSHRKAFSKQKMCEILSAFNKTPAEWEEIDPESKLPALREQHRLAREAKEAEYNRMMKMRHDEVDKSLTGIEEKAKRILAQLESTLKEEKMRRTEKEEKLNKEILGYLMAENED